MKRSAGAGAGGGASLDQSVRVKRDRSRQPEGGCGEAGGARPKDRHGGADEDDGRGGECGRRGGLHGLGLRLMVQPRLGRAHAAEGAGDGAQHGREDQQESIAGAT